MNKLTFSYFEAGKKIEMAGKMLAKARKLYKSEIARGLKPEQAKRNASGQARGKTLRQAQGHRKEELQVKARGTAKGQKMPKPRQDRPKSSWKCYSYSTNTEEYIGFSSYDHTKTQYVGYEDKGQKELFAMHQYFEREVQHWFKEGIENLAAFEEIQIDFDEEKKYKHRQFEWKLFNEDHEVEYFITYEKGQIKTKSMWEGFDYEQFELEIREQRIWD